MIAPLPRPVKAVIDAANAGDTRAFLAAFTPDGVVDDWGRSFRGATEIPAWSEKEFIGVHVTLEIHAVEQRADETTVTADVGGEGYNGPSRFAFQVADERVTRMTISG